jgi:hypothetical protein
MLTRKKAQLTIEVRLRFMDQEFLIEILSIEIIKDKKRNEEYDYKNTKVYRKIELKENFMIKRRT